MAKVPVQFGEWRPDIALLDTQFASEALNVFASINSYKPFPSLLPITTFGLGDPVTDPPCGLYTARTAGGSWKVYGGTRKKLWTWNAAGWTDISRFTTTPGDDPYNVSPGDLWSFEQSGGHLVAVNINDDPQWIDINSGSNFEALPGSPPRATNVRQIGDFLFLSGQADVDNRKIIWSGINDITSWVIGVNLCDEQEFPDGGPVQGIAGNEIGYVVQERAVRSMQFLPGDTNFIFNFSRVLHDRGSISKYGWTSIGNVLYFVAEDGFYSISGTQVTPVGADKVNDWWLTNSDITRRNVVQAIAGINKPRIAWAFNTFSGSQVYDHVIIFDWSNGRWVHAQEFAYVWGLLASPGLDLDTTGTEPGDVDADSTALPLDSFAYVGGRPLIGAIDDDGMLCALTGPNLPATLETSEFHLAREVRAFVSGVYPMVDGAAETVTAGTRERLQDPVVWELPQLIEITGEAAVYSSARLHRFRVTVPAGATWTHAQGALVEAQQDGSVA